VISSMGDPFLVVSDGGDESIEAAEL